MAASDATIRPIRADERADWEPLWKGYQAFYKVVISDQTTAVTWARLHDPAEPMEVLGAYLGERLCGIVHYLFHRSCWTTGDYCYLQDLFVAESARNLGLGRALILAVEDRARAAGASRIYWLTHETNADARVLYDRLAERPGFIQYRKLF
jgi:GNAT superfamily N-acetyltransferase